MNYFVIDFETGGLDCEKHAITEIGIVVIDSEKLQTLHQYQSYIYPYDKAYDQQALTATNIPMSLLKTKGKDAKEVCGEFEQIMSKYTARSFKDKLIWVGHNPLFDIGFANVFLNDFSKNTLEKYFTGKLFGEYFIPTHFDTMSLGRAKWNRSTIPSGSYTLSNICQKAGIDLSDAHSALNDTMATKDIFSLFISFLRSEKAAGEYTEQNLQSNRFRTQFEI